MVLFNWLKKAILLIGSKSSSSRTDAVRVNDKNAKNQMRPEKGESWAKH